MDVSGKLVALREVITLPGMTGGGAGTPTINFEACEFDATGDLSYSLETLSIPSSFVALGFGCPNPSANNRPEQVVIVPENGGKEFSYLEFTVPSPVFDQDVPAHFSGHAVAQKALP
ncbi:MAG: hypothetical protein JO033_12710 [Acidobacteriaceae bacterium]|nr:hypothetical protein [Acidobacteriaceae bacterium]MBV9498823.1 hypothetical protein [Acidobacteriaceae bacterium]